MGEESVGFIGLGAMGLPMARHLLRAGYRLRVYNRTATKAEVLAAEGARCCDRPADVVDPGGVVVSMVTGDGGGEVAALEAVTLGKDGILERLGPGGVHVVTSMISPARARAMADLHERRHCSYVAAPVFGRPDQAAARKLWIPVAGDSRAKERVNPLLSHLGQGTFDLGPDPAIACVAKICGNVLIGSAMAALTRALNLAGENGLDPTVLADLLGRSLFDCSVYRDYGPMAARGQISASLPELLQGLADLLDRGST